MTGPSASTATPSRLTTPIYETTTFVFETRGARCKAYNEGKSTKFLYSRYANPTMLAVEKSVAALEGAESALLLSSGMAATTTALLALLKAGDEVVCSAAIYGGTLHLLADLFPPLRHQGAVRVARRAARSRSASSAEAHEARLVRVADQPDAALRRHRGDGRGVPRRAA